MGLKMTNDVVSVNSKNCLNIYFHGFASSATDMADKFREFCLKRKDESHLFLRGPCEEKWFKGYSWFPLTGSEEQTCIYATSECIAVAERIDVYLGKYDFDHNTTLRLVGHSQGGSLVTLLPLFLRTKTDLVMNIAGVIRLQESLGPALSAIECTRYFIFRGENDTYATQIALRELSNKLVDYLGEKERVRFEEIYQEGHELSAKIISSVEDVFARNHFYS